MVRARATAHARRTVRGLLDGLRRPREKVVESDPANHRRLSRVDAAMDVVQRVEEMDPELPETRATRDFLTVDRVARRPGAETFMDTMVPSPLQGAWVQDRPGVQQALFPVAADLVVLAKFDLGEQVKLRAGYGDPRRTLAVAPVRPNGTCPITNSVRAHEIVTRYAPGLIPRMLSHGELEEGLRYLVEEWVEGEPLTDSLRLAAHTPQILEGLGRVHEGYGIHGRSVSELWGGGFGEEWQAVRDAGLVPDGVGAAVAALIADNRRLRMSWSHGDLVASNVLSTPGGPVIIDWEHARERPVMHDAAKLHLFAADKEPLLGLLLSEWGDNLAEDGYTAAEELALMHAHFLSRAPARMVDLAGHRRSGVYTRQVTKQVALLGDVLGRIS